MVKGLGTDILEIARFATAVERQGERFLTTLFTPDELLYCRKYRNAIPHFAVRFAAKEAIVKAIGGWRSFTWRDFSIVPDETGKPVVHISGGVKKSLENPQFLISLSHSDHYATATAIWL